MLQKRTNSRFKIQIFLSYKAQKIPKNIADEYYKFHNIDLVGENLSFIKSVLKNFKRMINF